MKKQALLGLFSYVDDCVTAIEELKKAGCKEMEVHSPIPSHDIEEAIKEEEKLPFSFSLDFFKKILRKVFIERDFQVARFTAIGAFFGIMLAWTLAGGTAALWPIQTGGMPILALPPIGLVTYELMSLGAATFSVFGFFFLAKLFRQNLGTYNSKVSDDKFSIIVYDSEEKLTTEAKNILEKCGCEKIEVAEKN